MSYIKNSLIIFMFCYFNFLLNDDSKKMLNFLIEKTLKKYEDNIEDISELIELSLLEPSGIRKNNIDVKEKINSLYKNIEALDSKELEKDINYIAKKMGSKKFKK